MTVRIILLVTSPRLPAGLLSAAAWDAVRAYPVFAGAESEQAVALRAAGVPVTGVAPDPAQLLAAIETEIEAVVWLAAPAGRILFAGEHTSLEWQGYINGALTSGQRAAMEVLALAGWLP